MGMFAQIQSPGPSVRPAASALAAWTICVALSSHALANDDDDDNSPKPTAPTTYIDLRTT